VLTPNYRALIHASSILVPVLVKLTSKPLILVGLGVVTVAYVIEELLRFRERRVPLISQFTLKMSRQDERSHFIAAPVFLALGIILALILFPQSIAYSSIAVVAVGDPVAGYVGRRFGRNHVGGKTWEGFAVGSMAAFVPTLLFVSPFVGAIGSIAGMSLELSGVFQDNLTIPFAAGIAMFLASIVMVSIVL